jgi:thioredoxin-like negative regulator of GroEL
MTAAVVTLVASTAQAQQTFRMPDSVLLPVYRYEREDQDLAKFNREVLEKPGMVLVEFMSPSCIACNPAARMINQVLLPYQGEVRWIRLDIGRNIGLSYKYDIPRIPAVLLFTDGRFIRKCNLFNDTQKETLARAVDAQWQLLKDAGPAIATEQKSTF